MNKAQFLHIITSLWKLCGVHTFILLKITMILKSCLTNSTRAQAFSRKNSVTFLQVSKSTEGFLTDVVGDNSAELISHTYITRKGTFHYVHADAASDDDEEERLCDTHHTKKGGNQCAHSDAASGYC